MNLRQKAVKGVVWSAIQSWGRQALSFIVFALLARLLEPQAFGLVALAAVFIAFIQIFLDQGFSDAIVQRQNLEPEHLDTAFWINLVIGALMTMISITAAGLVANLFNQPQLAPVIRVLSISFLLSALSSVQVAIFRRNLAFKPLAVRSLIAEVTGGLVGLTMAFMGFGVWSLVGKQLTSGLAQVLVLWWASDWRPALNISRKHFKELFSFGVNVVGIKFVDFFNRRSDDLLIGYFLGSVALGYYTIAYRILLVMTELLTSIIGQVEMPILSKLQQEPEKIRSAFYKVTQSISLISFPTFIGTAALAPELVQVLFGEQWLPSIPVMQILSFIGMVHSVSYSNGSVIMAMGKPLWKLKLNCMHAVANVLGFIIAVRWGIVAVASVYVIRSYLLTPVDLCVVRRLIGIRLTTYIFQYAAPLSGSLGMVVAIFFTKYFFNDLINIYGLLAICTLMGALTYVSLMLLIAPNLIRQMLNLVNSFLPRKAEDPNKS